MLVFENEEIQKASQTLLIEFYHVGSQMRLLVCVSIYGQELYVLEDLCCDVVFFPAQKSDRIGEYLAHPILSYIFFLRRQQVMQSALLISSQILLTHPLKKFSWPPLVFERISISLKMG